MNDIDTLFSGDVWSGFHDVIVDTLDVAPTKNQAMSIFKKLPDDVQKMAFDWGIRDTVFRDEAYRAIEKHGIEISN